MQEQNVLGPPLAKTCPYTGFVPHRPSKARPPQGALLLRLRKSAGLTQMELGEFLGVPHSNIVFWEWSDKPPRSDLLPKLAQALNVSVQDLLFDIKNKSALAKRSGPVGEVQRVFEEVRCLPRHQQRRLIETVSALLNEYKRKAS